MKTQTQHPLSGLKSGAPDDQLPSRAITAAVTPFPPRSVPSAKRSRSWLLLLAVILGVAMPLNALAQIVTSLADSGPGSLREVLTSGQTNVSFNLPGAGPWTIQLTSGPLLINRAVEVTGGYYPGGTELRSEEPVPVR